MLRRGNHPKGRGGQRPDHQAEAHTGDQKVGVQHGDAENAENVVLLAQHVLAPVVDQPVAVGGDQQPEEGHHPVAHAGGDPAAQHRPDRQRDQEPQQQPGGLGLVHLQHALAEQLHVHQGDHQRRTRGQRCAQRGQERAEVHPAGSISRVRENRSHSMNSTATTTAPMTSGSP